MARDPGLFARELRLLSRSGKAGDLVELYRRMAAAVAARRCEAFCGEEEEEEEEEREEQKGKGTKAAEERKKKSDEGASPLFAGLCGQQGPMQHQQQRQRQQQQPRAGIEVLR